MNLTDAQKQIVTGWIADGLKLAEIQKRIGSEFGKTPTYMEVRFLVDDLKLVPKDPEPPKPVESATIAPASAPVPAATAPGAEPDLTPPMATPDEAVPAAAAGNVVVTVDQITRPGAVVSGVAKFSDGQSCAWYLDQTGRFGMVPPFPGYKPSQPDLLAFQGALERELAKLGI
ncbi:MAG TPA: hypothetical protein VK968_07905 [Roseimicrobium sp.]|nr:hypothetical protein [Roseimicrobium sp.]